MLLFAIEKWTKALIGPSFGVLYQRCWLSKDRLVRAMLRHAHFYMKGGKPSFAAGAKWFVYYTPSPAEAEFDGLTAGLGTIQLCL